MGKRTETMPAALIAGTVVGAIVKGKSEKQAANAQVDAKIGRAHV